jgi:hypothetical protein
MGTDVSWLLRRRFLLLLLALALLLVVHPVLGGAFGTRLLFDALFTIVYLTGILAVFTKGPVRLLGLLLGIPTVVGAWTGYAFPGLPRLPLALSFHVVAALFLGFTAATILRSIYREESVSADSIYGAFCGYLLVALAFGHLYCLIETTTPESFAGAKGHIPQLQAEDRQHFLLTYFSLCTLTTVGYGDITPAKEAARALAVLEAVLGQFYIAVLIGELIGIRVSQAVSGRRSAPPC